MIAGEGVVMLLVKDAVAAIEQGDTIYALLRGIEVNNDGREKVGFYAPSFSGQSKVIRKVFAATGVDPESISYVEAHGTGTKLGDPIEFGALTEAYRRSGSTLGGKRKYCGVGSLKSNIGHLDTAAGLAGCMKAALSLHHGAIPPSINFSEPNPDIDFDNSPFYVVDKLTPWRNHGGPRRAAVSSFGIGGTNAHAILESYDCSRPPAAERAVVLPICAKTPERLTAYVRSVRDFLLADDVRGQTQLGDLAYTFQIGREPMDCRAAFVAANRSELIAKLSEYLSGAADIAGVFRGEQRRGETEPALFEDDADIQDFARRWLAQGRIDKLAQLWVRGVQVDWKLLYETTGMAGSRRIPAPTYPFAKQRFPLTRSVGGRSNERPRRSEAEARTGDGAVTPANVKQVGTVDARPMAARGESGGGDAQVARWDGKTYLVQWQEEAASDRAEIKLDASAVALIVCAGESAQLDEMIRETLGRNGCGRTVALYLRAEPTEQISRDEWICDVRDPFGVSACLDDIPTVQAVFFLTDAAAPGFAAGEVHRSQLNNELQLYRLSKYLRNFGKVGNSIECFFLTFDHYDLGTSSTHAAGGGVNGLAYAVAQREHRFRVRNIDLSTADLPDAAARQRILQTLLETPASARGEVIKVAPEGRYRQVFIPLAYERAVKPGIAEHGVYVIAGGGGAVGHIVTRGLMQKYHAQVIWLGRTPAADRALQEKLSEFDRFGARPTYIQADVTDPQSLRDAVKRIGETYGRINGALFLACHIYGPAESLDASEEAAFSHSLNVKTQGTVAFYAAFEHEPLDFMCYFSSAQAFSFSGASKLAALATGVTFSDAFVRSLRERARFPVGTINWGAWQSSLGSALSEHMGALTDEEGFACFENVTGALRNADQRQFVCLSVSAGVRGLMNCRAEEQLVIQADAAPSMDSAIMASIRAAVRPVSKLPEVFRQQTQSLPVSFDECLARIVLLRLRAMGVFTEPGVFTQPQVLREEVGVISKYGRWWTECLRILHTFGYVEYQNGKVGAAPGTFTDEREWAWAPWNAVKKEYLADPDRRAFVPIAEACFDRLHEVLRGATLATDVLFPGGSMKQMEGVYRANAVADYFNNAVADVIEACVRSSIDADPQAQVRIVEVGAGTGGTTSKVLPRLGRYTAHISEYCYTDLSKAFLLMAEDQFRASAPYLTCRLWDVDKPVADHDAFVGRYDIVIATNVLHATKNVRRALANAKTALRKGGVMVLNEGTLKNIYGTLIMGLLDGWWLYEDEAYRIPGCPYLDTHAWRRVLTLRGFPRHLLSRGTGCRTGAAGDRRRQRRHHQSSQISCTAPGSRGVGCADECATRCKGRPPCRAFPPQHS